MPRLTCKDLTLNYEEHGSGDTCILAIHGNLGCTNWLDLVMPLMPQNLRIITVDWRGCGKSDKPIPDADYANYSMAVHARDHLALLDELGISFCHLYGHSTGGIIASHLLTLAPERFGKVLMLDPISPLGAELHPDQLAILAAMRDDFATCFAGMATAAPTLFDPTTLTPGKMPTFGASISEAQRSLFNQLIESTRVLSDGIWFGTPHNLAKEWASGELAAKMPEMTHEHLILYGEKDAWIPRAHLEAMIQQLPHAKLLSLPDIGHSMNLEQPARFAKIFADFFTETSQN
jgi:non-heme chloroperoxidase